MNLGNGEENRMTECGETAGRQLSFAIHTLGCKVNTYESDLIAEQMRKAGFRETGFGTAADICIINTCTVTNIADRKSRQMLHRARKLNPAALIVAAGCYVDAVEQKKGLPETEVDLWIPNREKNRTAELIRMRLSSGIACPAEAREQADTAASFLTELDGHTRAFVKIEDGCGMFCTYCIIPYVRGPVIARPVEETVREVEGLVRSGVREIVLTGIHLSSMGAKLCETVERINGIPGVSRIRLGSLEPRLITPGFITRMKNCEKLCHHFHLSLQSGSDEILRKMHRRYTAAEFLESCRLLREAWPDTAVTTDIIVGFPGETEEQFLESLAFAEKARFYEAHVFRYSRRKGTEADRMEGQLTEAVKAERSARLIRLCEELSREYRKNFLNRQLEFLAEEAVELAGIRYITGYTREYIRCMLPENGRNWKPGVLLSGTASEPGADGNLGDFLYLRED